MIPGKIVYLRPDSMEEALAAWSRYPDARYLAGGTEIHTAARRSAAYHVGALVDIKRLPELTRLAAVDGALYLGAALSLSSLAEAADWPLMSAVIRSIADRTVRNRLSLGGNVAGQLPYREAVLPLLLADARLHTLPPATGGSPLSQRVRPLRACFDKRLQLEPGELVLGFSVPLATVSAVAGQPRWYHRRHTRTGPVDYPVLTLCAQAGAGGAALATSGLYPYPWRSAACDAAFTQALLELRSLGGDSTGGASRRAVHSAAEYRGRAETLAALVPPPRGDSRASADYRLELLVRQLEAALKELS